MTTRPAKDGTGIGIGDQVSGPDFDRDSMKQAVFATRRQLSNLIPDC
jgi:hypothetical protein